MSTIASDASAAAPIAALAVMTGRGPQRSTIAPTGHAAAADARSATENAPATAPSEALSVETNGPRSAPNDDTIAVLQYLPGKVTVEVGQTVTWDWSGTIEPHSVTFLAPGQNLPEPGSDTSLFAPTPANGPIDGNSFVNSGLQPVGTARPQPMTLSFNRLGTFSYYCVIHPQMVGEVEVGYKFFPLHTVKVIVPLSAKAD